MPGICIVVTGRTGAGKTSLVKECVQDPAFNMEYMTNYVTRPPRKGDFGYTYITKDEYEKKRKASKTWDHFELFGEFYGTDAEDLIKKVNSGRNVILTTYPNMEEIDKIKKLYRVPLATIFIDIPRDVSFERIKSERQGHEIERLKKDDESVTQEVMDAYDHMFRAEGVLEKDIARFKILIASILQRQQSRS